MLTIHKYTELMDFNTEYIARFSDKKQYRHPNTVISGTFVI